MHVYKCCQCGFDGSICRPAAKTNHGCVSNLSLSLCSECEKIGPEKSNVFMQNTFSNSILIMWDMKVYKIYWYFWYSLFLLWEVSLKTKYDKFQLSVDANINNDHSTSARSSQCGFDGSIFMPAAKTIHGYEGFLLPYLYSGCERKGHEQSQFY